VSATTSAPAAAGSTGQSPPPVRKAPRRPKPAPGVKRISPMRVIGLAVVWLFTAFNILVLYWLIAAAFKTPIEIFRDPLSLPHQLFATGKPFRNFIYAWDTAEFGTAFVNTVLLVAVCSVVIVLISAPAAYALSRLGVRGSGPMTGFIAIGMGIPFQTVIIPMFIAMAKFGLTNNLFGLGLLYVALSLPFTVFLITALILNAIGLWNETLLAIVFLQENANFTLSRALFTFYNAAAYQSEYGGLLAGVAIIVLPMLVLYILLARRIITGLTLGAGK
jgi:N-acetylglucosamine transport system permease protein